MMTVFGQLLQYFIHWLLMLSRTEEINKSSSYELDSFFFNEYRWWKCLNEDQIFLLFYSAFFFCFVFVLPYIIFDNSFLNRLIVISLFYMAVSRRSVLCDWVWRAGVHTGFCTITLGLYIGSLPNLATWFPCGRGRTLFILGSLGQRSKSPLL